LEVPADVAHTAIRAIAVTIGIKSAGYIGTFPVIPNTTEGADVSVITTRIGLSLRAVAPHLQEVANLLLGGPSSLELLAPLIRLSALAVAALGVRRAVATLYSATSWLVTTKRFSSGWAERRAVAVRTVKAPKLGTASVIGTAATAVRGSKLT
jgi:hypothetical protein